jgi:hypothetical protein
MEKKDVDRIVEEVRACHHSVHEIVKLLGDEPLRDEESYQASIRALADSPLIREWLLDAGVTTWEIGVAQESTLAGAFTLNAIVEGIKTGLLLSARVMREESEIAIQAVQGWLAAEAMLKDSSSMKSFKEKSLPEQIHRTYTERQKQMLARAEALEADDSVLANATEAAFLRGRACESGKLADLVLKTYKLASDDSPEK